MLIGRFYPVFLTPVIVVGITDTIFTEISHEPKAAGQIIVMELKEAFFCHNIKSCSSVAILPIQNSYKTTIVTTGTLADGYEKSSR